MKLRIHNYVVAVVRKVCPKGHDPFYHEKYIYCVDLAEVRDAVSHGSDGREFYVFKAQHDYIGWGYARNQKSFLKWERKGGKMAKSAKKVAPIKKGAVKGGMKKGGKKGC